MPWLLTASIGPLFFAVAAQAPRCQPAAPHGILHAELAHRELSIGGEYQWRREGEYHLFNPETVFKLQHATRSGRYDVFQQYTRMVDDQAAQLAYEADLCARFPEIAFCPVPWQLKS